MKLRKLKKHMQEMHGWWDTKKYKSRYDYPDYLDADYYTHCELFNKKLEKFVHPPFYISSGYKVWRKAP